MLELFEKYKDFAVLCLIAAASLYLTRYILLPIFKKIAMKTKGKFDDLLVKHRAVERFAHIVPAILFYIGLPKTLSDSPEFFSILSTLNNIYFIVVGFLVYDSILHALTDFVLINAKKKGTPIQGVRQAALLVGFLICTILIISQLLGKSPVILLSGLGALSAVFMLIFKDSILGFAAGIQIAVLDLVRTGDWVEIPKEGINGFVESVSLSHIQVHNWDNTISTFPTYALVSTPYKNWRRMSETSRRRIQRSILVDGRTVAPISGERLEALRENLNAKKIFGSKLENLSEREMESNIRLFREYASGYIRSLDNSDKERTLFARELPSDGRGIPVEIYLFSKISTWADYETFSADIVDHLMSMLPFFGLRLYQRE